MPGKPGLTSATSLAHGVGSSTQTVASFSCGSPEASASMVTSYVIVAACSPLGRLANVQVRVLPPLLTTGSDGDEDPGVYVCPSGRSSVTTALETGPFTTVTWM